MLVVRLFTIEALRALSRNKLRSSLAILGIAVAVAIVITVAALGRASVQASEGELDKLGTNLIWVEAGARNTAGVRTGSHGMTTLTAQDAEAIRREVPLVREVSENVDGSFLVINGDRNWLARWRGVSPEYQRIKKWEIASGDFFTDEHTEQADRVVVLGETVRRELFGADDPIGETVTIQGAGYRVVGVLVPKGQSATGQDQDDTVMLPWTTAMRRIVGKQQTWLDDILCSAASQETIRAAGDQISSLLRMRHHIADDADPDFNIRHPEELLQARLQTSRTLRLLLLVLASISLLVGGIGIMNVMLAAVSQRVTEIGIRASVGARPNAIRLQFLGEALMLTFAGGAFGIALGELLAYVFEHHLDWRLERSMTTNAIAVIASAAVGIVFGFYPASRAARIDPILALRREA